jgi:hypothetical protein
MLPQIRPPSLPFTSFSIYCSLIAILFDVTNFGLVLISSSNVYSVVFWVITSLFNLVTWCQYFEWKYCLRRSFWTKMRKGYDPSEHLYPPTGAQHSVTIHKTAIWIFTPAKTWNPSGINIESYHVTPGIPVEIHERFGRTCLIYFRNLRNR